MICTVWNALIVHGELTWYCCLDAAITMVSTGYSSLPPPAPALPPDVFGVSPPFEHASSPMHATIAVVLIYLSSVPIASSPIA